MLDMPFAEVQAMTERQVGYHSRRYVPGMEQEDVAQELAIVLWKVQESFDKGIGSFANVLEIALRNKMQHLRRVGNRQVSPIERLLCRACGEGRQVAWRPTCTCGSRSFDEVRGTATSLDIAMGPGDPGEGGDGGAARFEGRYLSTMEPGYAVADFNMMLDGITL